MKFTLNKHVALFATLIISNYNNAFGCYSSSECRREQKCLTQEKRCEYENKVTCHYKRGFENCRRINSYNKHNDGHYDNHNIFNYNNDYDDGDDEYYNDDDDDDGDDGYYDDNYEDDDKDDDKDSWGFKGYQNSRSMTGFGSAFNGKNYQKSSTSGYRFVKSQYKNDYYNNRNGYDNKSKLQKYNNNKQQQKSYNRKGAHLGGLFGPKDKSYNAQKRKGGDRFASGTSNNGNGSKDHSSKFHGTKSRINSGSGKSKSNKAKNNGDSGTASTNSKNGTDKTKNGTDKTKNGTDKTKNGSQTSSSSSGSVAQAASVSSASAPASKSSSSQTFTASSGTSSTSSSSDSSKKAGIIAGAVAGAFVLILLFLGLGYCCFKKNKAAGKKKKIVFSGGVGENGMYFYNSKAKEGPGSDDEGLTQITSFEDVSQDDFRDLVNTEIVEYPNNNVSVRAV